MATIKQPSEYACDVWVDNREVEKVCKEREAMGYVLDGSHIGDNVSTMFWRLKNRSMYYEWMMRNK